MLLCDLTLIRYSVQYQMVIIALENVWHDLLFSFSHIHLLGHFCSVGLSSNVHWLL